MLGTLVACWSASHALSTDQLKIYAAGSGLDMLSQPETVAEIIELSGKLNPRLLYLGTATYDDPSAAQTQTAAFLDAGAVVTSLAVAWLSPPLDEMRALFEAADIVLVSGGNTLFARDRWVKLGIDALMWAATINGTVMCGGSAGGIVWFDGGHSDSMDIASYKNPPGPYFDPNLSEAGYENWAYIRVPGIAFVPGFFCPHYDVTGSNGVPRAVDFTAQLQQHSGENGIGVDNWAALVINGDAFTVVSRQGHPGSVAADGSFTPNGDGVPGVWRMGVGADGALVRSLVPSAGKVASLLTPATYVVQSNLLDVARGQNPDDGVPAAWNSTSSPVRAIAFRNM